MWRVRRANPHHRDAILDLFHGALVEVAARVELGEGVVAIPMVDPERVPHLQGCAGQEFSLLPGGFSSPRPPSLVSLSRNTDSALQMSDNILVVHPGIEKH